jgi:hypothetical protein
MNKWYAVLLTVFFIFGCSTSSDVATGDLKAPFSENKAQIESCYEKVAKKQPDLANGTVELKFLINDDGKAYKTIYMKKRSTLYNKLLNACLKKVVHGWQFPTGKSLEVVYPFNFEKSTANLGGESQKTTPSAASEESSKSSDLDVIDNSPKEDETSGDEEESTPED